MWVSQSLENIPDLLETHLGHPVRAVHHDHHTIQGDNVQLGRDAIRRRNLKRRCRK
jgi:hypothetical protein